MTAQTGYEAHEVLVAPVRHKAQLWRLLLGLGLIAAVSYVLNTLVVTILIGLDGGSRAPNTNGLLEALISGDTPLSMLILLGTFSFLTCGVGLAVHMLQGRSLFSVLGPTTLMIRQFIRVGLALMMTCGLILLLPPYDFGGPLTVNLGFWPWLGLLPLSLLAVLVQVSAEEVVFRGYMQQALAARFRSPVVWVLLPSVLFGLSHYMPDEAGENAWLICLWAMCFGVLMADLTARAGTLGPAIAVHFVNNTVALLIFASPSSLYGLALYLLPYELSNVAQLRPWMLVDCAMMLVGWLVARLAIRR